MRSLAPTALDWYGAATTRGDRPVSRRAVTIGEGRSFLGVRALVVAIALSTGFVVCAPSAAAPPRLTPASAVCTGSSVGPGIAPPAGVPSGIPGFHASW